MPEKENKWAEWTDTRNVLDKYKGFSVEDIKSDLKKNALPFAVLMAQIVGDFNFSSVIRSANAFGASDVFYYGNKRFDRRGSCGTHHYSDVTFLSFPELKALRERFTFVALENNIEREIVPLNLFDWNTALPPLIIVGEEGLGTGMDVLDMCSHFVEIPMRGSVRSLNAASAASIAMYDYTSKKGRNE